MFVFSTCSDTIFPGDMNCCPSYSNTLNGICDLCGLRNLIKEPTCHKGKPSTLMDVVLEWNPRKYLIIELYVWNKWSSQFRWRCDKTRCTVAAAMPYQLSNFQKL